MVPGQQNQQWPRDPEHPFHHTPTLWNIVSRRSVPVTGLTQPLAPVAGPPWLQHTHTSRISPRHTYTYLPTCTTASSHLQPHMSLPCTRVAANNSRWPLLLSSPIPVKLQGSTNKILRVSSVLGHHLETTALMLACNMTSTWDIFW